eukprot:gnl/TRDRNA2_/TRDRNA2_128214_c2_seq1.p1 gnl/TRDRNA2_/TRDRNA2_128214_c2~~gnl/TRDRNA2_/TRDRNA2_128214_c2_seq1.p1  ORF type:complete len:550 (+),score=94.96 gnl/TRDRNA2_/TRDRNA2_128214_c2_seq1:187-1650(+)
MMADPNVQRVAEELTAALGPRELGSKQMRDMGADQSAQLRMQAKLIAERLEAMMTSLSAQEHVQVRHGLRSADNLIDRAHEVSHVHSADLDHTTLAKSGHLAINSRMSSKPVLQHSSHARWPSGAVGTLGHRGLPPRASVVPRPHIRHVSGDSRLAKRDEVFVAAAAADAAAGDAEEWKGGVEGTGKADGFLGAFWKFLRPHTIRGTILGSFAVTARALIENPNVIDWMLLPRAVIGVFTLLCGNGFIVGVNQIYDVEIDKVNKPFLPVAAGELSIQQAWVLCGVLGVIGLVLARTQFGPLIGNLYAVGLGLGLAYSVPPLRLKRNAVAAFLIIAFVRGFLLNFGVYYAVRAALHLDFIWSLPTLFITGFVTLFAIAIAVSKDLPDIAGDRLAKVQTFATMLGERRTTFLASGLLLCNYVAAVTLAIVKSEAFRAPLMAGAHTVFAAGLIWATARLDKAKYSEGAIKAYYQFVWMLFYSEYILFPFI